MQNYKKIKIQGENGFPTDIDLFGSPFSALKMPLIIFSHGFKGFKDWGGFPYMLGKIADAGFISAGFNFTYNGVDDSYPAEFTRPDLFAKNTFSRELKDLESVIEHFYSNSETYNINREKISLIGHSRGGGLSIIKASEDNRIKCLITLAAVSDFDRYSDEQKKKWKAKGYLDVLNSRTGQMMRINSTLLEDIEKNKQRLDIKTAAGNLHIPFLIIHGKEDLSVRFSEAEEIYANSDKNRTELFPVENTGHTFGIVHPFAGTTNAFEKVIDKIIEFLDKTFGKV